jgi:hypothetical protein
MTTILQVLAVAFVLSWIPAIAVYYLARRRAAGERVITCPETRTTEVVRVDAGHAAWSEMRGDRNLRLEKCSRWPEKKECGQDCLREIEASPDGCLVRERLENWYRGSQCALCGMAIGPVHWFEYRPGLLTTENRVVAWEDLPARDLPTALAVGRPICSDCCVAESFRAQFPERVLDDPWHTVNRPETRSPGPMA